jgi:hypothetical protein
MQYINLQVAAKLCEFYDAGSLAVRAAETIALSHGERAATLANRRGERRSET